MDNNSNNNNKNDFTPQPWKFANSLGRDAFVVPIPSQIGNVAVHEIVCAAYNGRVRKLDPKECPAHSPHVIGMVIELEPEKPNCRSVVLRIQLLDTDMQSQLKCICVKSLV